MPHKCVKIFMWLLFSANEYCIRINNFHFKKTQQKITKKPTTNNKKIHQIISGYKNCTKMLLDDLSISTDISSGEF